MIAFFDTNLYINLLKGKLPGNLLEDFCRQYIIRLCPVVYHELIRCIQNPSLRKKVEKITEQTLFLPAPTPPMWTQAAELASKVMGSTDEKTLESIQNDLLIALTARYNGAVLITGDKHFKVIRKHLSFEYVLVDLYG